MAGYPDFVPYAADYTGDVNQKGGALDAHIFAAIHALLDPYAVFFAHLAADVRGEDKGQFVLLLKFVVRGDRVLGYPDDDCAGFAIIRERVAEPASLGGAA